MRQVWVVGVLFAVGTLVGAILTVLELRPRAAPLFSEAELAAIEQLPFGVAYPAYVPEGGARLAIRCDRADGGEVAGCLLEYKAPQGCFAVWSGRGTPPLAGQGLGRPVYNSALGRAQLFTDPVLASSPLRSADGSLHALLGREAVEARFECPRSLKFEEASRVLAGLRLIGAPPTKVPPPNTFE